MRIKSAPNYGQSAPTRTHSNFSQLASILLQCKCRANIVTQLASILFSNNRAKWGSNTVAQLSHCLSMQQLCQDCYSVDTMVTIVRDPHRVPVSVMSCASIAGGIMKTLDTIVKI